jgi:hypothetical protein
MKDIKKVLTIIQNLLKHPNKHQNVDLPLDGGQLSFLNREK